MASVRKSRDTLEEIHDFFIDKQHRIIYIHSDFSVEEVEEGINWRTASRFIKNLDYLESLSKEPIIVKLITPGGDWNTGMAIFDRIANSNCYITTVSYAHARSMSSIIIQSADKRQISKHADFMVHYGTYGDEGDWRAVKNGIEHYNKSNEVMLNIYANKCQYGEFFKSNGLDLSKTKAYIKKQIEEKTDWWMSAEEAIYFGFIDEIIN